MRTELDTARHEATFEVSKAVIQAISDVLDVHGDDPMNEVIVSAGIEMAVRKIGERAPMVLHILRRALQSAQ